jgi:hypothetical protein
VLLALASVNEQGRYAGKNLSDFSLDGRDHRLDSKDVFNRRYAHRLLRSNIGRARGFCVVSGEGYGLCRRATYQVLKLHSDTLSTRRCRCRIRWMCARDRNPMDQLSRIAAALSMIIRATGIPSCRRDHLTMQRRDIWAGELICRSEGPLTLMDAYLQYRRRLDANQSQ